MPARRARLLLEAYEAIGEATPLEGDCGALCGGACCQGEDRGMLLFPGEGELLGEQPGFRRYRVRLGGRREWLLICAGSCHRDRRPLSCRIFPLVPVVQPGGAVEARPDPRARAMCPLADREPRKEFHDAVESALRLMAEDALLLDFMARLGEAE